MGKISPVSAKYIVHATIEIDGVVDRPDVIGAIFGQTEGLLGADLELRELQRSGRIGRIEVNVDTKAGKSSGDIIIPSSLDKAETAIIAAALEVIQRIGPCNSKIHVGKIEDIRISKRRSVVERAKELLKTFLESSSPDSQELADEVSHAVRVMEIQEYGKDRLPAGPGVAESDEVIFVEGRADVLNLLKHGIKNAVGLGGTGVPQTAADLSKEKIVTVFVDGDRGGDLIVKGLNEVASIDYVTRAPDGKEVEEITKKEIHQALRSRVAAEQYKPADMRRSNGRTSPRSQPPQRTNARVPPQRSQPPQRTNTRAPPPRAAPAPRVSDKEKAAFGEMVEGLIGTKGALILDNKLAVLGKVPVAELEPTIKSLATGSVYAVIFDGAIAKELAYVAEKVGIKHVVGMSMKGRVDARVNLMTADSFE
jgi:DNA primase